MAEDLIEIVTSLTINGELSDWLLKLCRLSTREEEVILKQKYFKFRQLLPEQIGVESYFTLNKSSRIMKMLEEFKAKNFMKRQTTLRETSLAEPIIQRMTEESGTSIRRFKENERDPSEIIERNSENSESVDIDDLGASDRKFRITESLRNSSVVLNDLGKRSTKIVRVSELS